MAILKAALYILAVLFLVGGGLCAATSVFIPMDGMGGVALFAVIIMAVGFVVMKVVGKPKFSAGSAGEAVVFTLLFMIFILPSIQTPFYMLGMEMAAPFVSLAALAGFIYFIVRRYKSHEARRNAAPPPASDPPPPQA
jgi:uncharacterized membrane protein YcaP (DUF421 family)